jgi:hypothetical protein
MARRSWLSQIRNAASPADQVVALRALKNDLVGHPLKKEMAVTQGVLDPIVHLSFNKTVNRSDGKAHDHTFAHRPLMEEEMVRLQGLQVLASIALGRILTSPAWHQLTIYRRPVIPGPSTICIRSTRHSLEPLPVE